MTASSSPASIRLLSGTISITHLPSCCNDLNTKICSGIYSHSIIIWQIKGTLLSSAVLLCIPSPSVSFVPFSLSLLSVSRYAACRLVGSLICGLLISVSSLFRPRILQRLDLYSQIQILDIRKKKGSFLLSLTTLFLDSIASTDSSLFSRLLSSLCEYISD